ncbi:hypothetical protein Tco_1047310, partial [Tanacetum coccineum]
VLRVLVSKSKVTSKSDSPKSRWILMSERLLNKPGDDIVFNSQPVCQYNPITCEVIKESDKAPVVKEKPVDIIKKSTVVKESDKAPVVAAVVSEKSAVDEKENPKVTSKVSKGNSLDGLKYKRKTELPKDNPKDKESHKAPVVAAVVSKKSAVDEKDNLKVTSKVSNVSDESDKATVVAPILKEKPGNVIEKSVVVKESDKAPVVKESDKAPVVKESDKAPVVAPVLKEKPADVIKKSIVVNEKEKPTVDVTSKVAKDKEKPAVDIMSKVGKSKVVVHKDKVLDVVLKDKPKGNPPSAVGKGNAPFVVGKAKDKPSVVKGKVSTELSKKKHNYDIPKDKPKPQDKHKVDSEVPVLRSKLEVKAKAFVSEDVKRKRMLSKEDRSKKKLELKMIKGKMVSDEVDYDEVNKLRRVLKKLKKIKIEYSDEESGMKSNKKGKKKEKQLTPAEAAHEEYLREFPTLRARTVSSSLFSAICEARINMWSFFLSEIGFSSFHNVSIDKIPSRLGRYALSKFGSTTYRLTFETSDYVEVSPSKIHDILGIPVGGISLFLLDVRLIEHEFVRSWVDQFYPKSLKEIRVCDITSKVISAQQVDFLFKVKFLSLFTNKMGRVAGLKRQICLDVVRHLREEYVIFEIDWCGYIHSFLEYSELPEKPIMQYLGPFTFLILLYLDSTKFDRFHVVHTRPAIRDWTSTLMRQRQDLETKEHVIGCLDLHNEWTEYELQEIEEDLMRKASSDYPGDRKLVELQEKYVQVFIDPISFDVDVNSVDELNDEDALGSNPCFGFRKIGLDDFDKQPSLEGTNVKKELVNLTQEGTVVEGNPTQCEIMSTPENYTQWLERNADLVGEIIDAITDEYLYGDLFGDNSVKMEVSNKGPPTSDRMPTRASNASASPGKQIVKPSSYLLSPDVFQNL